MSYHPLREEEERVIAESQQKTPTFGQVPVVQAIPVQYSQPMPQVPVQAVPVDVNATLAVGTQQLGSVFVAHCS